MQDQLPVDSVSRGYTMANPNDVHFTAKGHELLGRQVAESIKARLKAKWP